MKNSNSKILLMMFAALGFPNSISAQCDNTLQMDPTIIKEKLPNGLTYYIKHLPDAGEEIFMRFYINAGGQVETPNQTDVSHAIEHLAFRATKNFPLGISNYTHLLQEVGMKGRGRDIYASNGNLGTQYIFNAKANYPKSIDLGILWFQDIMDGLSLRTNDIDIERKTLIQERKGKSDMHRENQVITDSKFTSKIFPCLQDQEGYIEKIENFSADSLRKYYQDWYQPKNVGIVLVGNIPDLKGLEKELRNKFSGFENDKDARDLPNCDSDYFNRPNQFIIVERNSDTIKQFANRNLEINLFYRDSLIKQGNNIEGVKQQFLWELTIEVLRNYLQQLTQSYNNNFNVEVVNVFKQKKLSAANSIIIKSEEKHLNRAIEEVMSKINEVKTYGISKEEWDDLKNKQIQYFDQIILEYDRSPRIWTGDMYSNFQFEEPLLDQKYNILKEWMMKIELDDYNKVLKEFLSPAPQDIGIVIPENETFLYSEFEFRAIIQEHLEKTVIKKSQHTPENLLSKEKLKKLKPSDISLIGKRIHGGNEYKLKNGIRVILVKDDTIGEIIKIWGFSQKGASILPPKQIISAAKSSNIIRHSGLGMYTKFEIERFLKSINANIQVLPYISFNESGIKGRADVENIETLLQLVYLYFTAPRKDKEAFEHWKQKELQDFLLPSYSVPQADFDNDVGMYFGRSNVDLLSGSHHFVITQKANLDEAFNAYNAIFSDVHDYTFLITGKFDEEILLPEVQKYLGNLGSSIGKISKNELRKTEIKIPKGPIKQKLKPWEYYQMENVIFSIRYVQKADKLDWKKHLQVQLLSELIWEFMIELRTEEGFALYDIANYGSYNEDLSIYEVFLKLSCLPEEVNKIKIASRNIFRKIKEGDIDPILFEKVHQRLTSYYSKNGRYLDKESDLYKYYRYGNNWVDFDEKEKFLKKFTYKDIQQFAKSFISEKYLFEFVM